MLCASLQKFSFLINTRALCKTCKVVNVQENKEEAIILLKFITIK